MHWNMPVTNVKLMLTNVMNFAKLAGIEISPNETKRQTELLTIGKNLIQDQLGNGGESRTATEVSISLTLALAIGCWCYILICKHAYTLIYWGVFGCIWDWISNKGCGFWLRDFERCWQLLRRLKPFSRWTFWTDRISAPLKREQ